MKSKKLFRRWLQAAATLPIAAAGLMFASSGVAHGAPPVKLPICHATASATNPYVTESPNTSVQGLDGGHLGHKGGLYPSAGWGDIIPPFDYTDHTGALVHYAGQNWDAAGQAILNNGCVVPIAPVAPTVTESTCVGGAPSAPTLTLATAPPGVTYSVSPGGRTRPVRR